MAGLSSVITVSGSEYRPCIVKGRKALFHRWEEVSRVYNPVSIGEVPGQIKHTVAIIEYEDGVVAECYPYEIRFCDNKFQEFCFPEQGK